MQSVCFNGRGIPETGTDLFVDDDVSTTRQVNPLIRLIRRYRDNDTVDEEVGEKTTLANRWAIRRQTRACGTLCQNVGGNNVATQRQIQIIDNGLRPALIKGSLSNCVEPPGCEPA